MTLPRSDLGQPFNMSIIDYNGAAAFAAADLQVRTYPGLIPMPNTAIAWSGERLTLLPWQRTLWLHAELALIVGRDVAADEGETAADAVLGYSVGLGIWDDSMVADLKRGTARDFGINSLYGYMVDGSRRQAKAIYTPEELPALSEITLTMHIAGHEPVTFPQGDLINDGPAVLREASRILPFYRGDVICLGPASAPLILPSDKPLPAGSEIRVEGLPFEPLIVPVDDQRDANREMPWPGRKP